MTKKKKENIYKS